MYRFNWALEPQQHESAYNKMDSFFEELHENADKNISGVKVAYREPQQKFASTVMEAIRDKNILLIEAGVGTGKSFGYLIPIFYTMNEVTTFDKVIISTSSIALQEQLLKDIDFVSELLGFKIKAWVSKGINNYACIRRIDQKMLSARRYNDEKTIQVLNEMKNIILKRRDADKMALPTINTELWHDIRVKGGCERCTYNTRCPFIEQQYRVQNVPIVVTNHTQLSNMIKNKEDLLTGASLLVVDEAHKLEEQMRLANQGILNFDDIFSVLNSIKASLYDAEEYDTTYDKKIFKEIHSELITELYEFAKAVRSNVQYTYKNQANREYVNIHDCEKLNFKLSNKRISDALEKLINSFGILSKAITKMPPIANLDRYSSSVEEFMNIFVDMKSQEKSENVYWVRFLDSERVEIIYTLKDLSKYFDQILERRKPVVFTSGTMTTNKEYDHFISSLNLTNNPQVTYEFPIPSPFDYKNNTLFYYDDTMVHPNSGERKEYIEALAIRVRDLIEITEGKALILFTSKTDMREVYNIVKHMGLKQNLILQDEINPNKCKESFMEDINSCLFATGVFWEGLDIPGKTLSNLIIARLPFPVQDPIVEYKKSSLSKQEQSQIDLNEMLMRLSQGTGRLIRSVHDTGIVCSLDCRTSNYLEVIKKTLPFTHYTNNLEDVVDFALEKISEPESNKSLQIQPVQNKNVEN